MLSNVSTHWRRASRALARAGASRAPGADRAGSNITGHLEELRRHLDHLREIRLRAAGDQESEHSLSFRNDVLFSRLTICQLAIDVAAELCAQRGERFEDHMQALRSLVGEQRFPADVVRELESLLGFRNVLIHGSAACDTDRVLEALEGIDPLQRFLEIVRGLARSAA